MTDRLVEDEHNRKLLLRFIENHKLPFTINIKRGRIRSVEQNRLWHMWCAEIAEQKEGNTTEDIRCYCKLTFGVPIRCRDDANYQRNFHADVRGKSYEQQLHLMRNYSVTRSPEMTTKQFAEMLDAINQHFSEIGVRLTQPDMQGMAA